jgi:hypothetical protein
VVFALGTARVAEAFPTSRLVYARGPGAEQCPDQDAVHQAVANRLGYDPFFPASDKTIVARIVLDSDHLKGQVELVDDQGVELGLREFAAEVTHCDDLMRAMALSISIAIDPKSAETYRKGPPDEPLVAEGSSESEPPAPPLAVTQKPPVASARAQSSALASPRKAPALQWSAGFGASGVFGAAPKATLGAFGFASVRSGARSLAIEAQANLPITLERDQTRFRTSTGALSLVPCIHFGVAFGCELTSLGWIDASGTQAAAKGGTSLLFSIGGRLGVELPLTSRFGLLAQASLLVNPWPVRLFAQEKQLWDTPIIAGSFGIGADLHF